MISYCDQPASWVVIRIVSYKVYNSALLLSFSFNRMDKDFANFDEIVRSQHEEMDRQISIPQLPLWAVPKELKSKWPSPMLKLSEEGMEVMRVNDKPGQQFEVTLDVSHFLPEELKVTVSDNMLSVEARHVGKDDDAAPGVRTTSIRQFSRKWTLPEDCRSDEVTSHLSSDGVLLVTAPWRTGTAVQHDEGKALQSKNQL